MERKGEISVKRVDEQEFLSLREEWNSLLSGSSSNNVFLRWEWIHTWWDVFRKERTLFILAIRQRERLIGIAPFYIESPTFLNARYLQICSHEIAPDYLDVIVEKGLEAAVMQEIVRCIKQYADEWDILVFDYLTADSSLLTQASYFEGLSYLKEKSIGCPYLVIRGSFDEYIRSRTKLDRLGLPKKIKTLFNKNGMRHAVLENPADLAKGIEDLFRLHKMRADNVGMRTNFLSADIERFHHKLGGLFLEQGILKLYLLYDGDTPVNAHYTFYYGNKIYSYQRGFNPEYKKWSVGSVCLYLEIQDAFAKGILEFDLLKGEDAYKLFWTDDVRPQFLFTAYSATWRGALWRAADRLIAVLKRVKRKIVSHQRTH